MNKFLLTFVSLMALSLYSFNSHSSSSLANSSLEGAPVAGQWIEGQIEHVGMELDYGLGRYYLYVPKSFESKKNRSLVVMLHGCMQKPEDFARGSRMFEQSEQHGFPILFPIQSKTANEYKCWNWFIPINQVRAFPYLSDFVDFWDISPRVVFKNEMDIVVKMISRITREYDLERDSAFLMGMSAGGSMASNLANCYPRTFKAVGIHHGVMYIAAALSWFDMDELTRITKEGSNVDPAVSGRSGFMCSSGIPTYGKKVMPTIIFQGTNGQMDIKHSEQIARQFSIFNDFLDDGLYNLSMNYSISKELVKSTGDKYSYTTYTWMSGDKPLTVRYSVDQMGHAWSGGDGDYKFNDEKGPDATKIMLKYFNKYGLELK
ncbi:MAG: prolyl oligopeptidase family serine peptidase [Bacteriovoracaceae bacterium]|nr:prolyl oligopeptidase family serine peptidase [Bacteriovoracaceae bacterium]